jgi:hypothetical protein
MDPDYTPQIDMKTTRLLAATFSITSSPTRHRRDDPELGCREFPPSGGFHCPIQARTQLCDISITCPAIPEILKYYCDRASLLELIRRFRCELGWITFLSIFHEKNRTFSEAIVASKIYRDPKIPPI